MRFDRRGMIRKLTIIVRKRTTPERATFRMNKSTTIYGKKLNISLKSFLNKSYLAISNL